jgi:esterase/lipase superfamily enzyme
VLERTLALSGRYDLTQAPDGFRNLLDGHYDQDVYFNMPNHYMTNIEENGILSQIRRLDIKIVIGENDPFLDDNRRFSGILWQKGVWHQFRVWSGRAHGYRRWRCWAGLFEGSAISEPGAGRAQLRRLRSHKRAGTRASRRRCNQ